MMMELDHSAAGIPVRADIVDTHRFIWEHVRAPGTWWTGAQRVAIAAEARQAVACGLCLRRKASLAVQGVAGQHDSLGQLPANVVDVIHRVRTDPPRLSRQWFNSVLASGLEAPAYVELIGVTTLVTGVDYFARALGIQQFPLPTPLPGAPSHHVPAAAKRGTAWVAMVAPEEASGAEADLYGGGGFVPNIVRALSLVPEEVRALRRATASHYVAVEKIPDPTARRALDRMQMELIAARVSALNECFY
jgi:hypothetical protein